MIETGNGIAQRLDDLGLQVNDDPMKIQPVGAAAGLATFEGVRREGGKGNNQYESLGAVSWVARNGKKITLGTPNPTNLTSTVTVDGVLCQGTTGGWAVTNYAQRLSDVLDFNGGFYIIQKGTGAVILDTAGVQWATLSTLNVKLAHVLDGNFNSLTYTDGYDVKVIDTPGGVAKTGSALGQLAYRNGNYFVVVFDGGASSTVKSLTYNGTTFTTVSTTSTPNPLAFPWVNLSTTWGFVSIGYRDGSNTKVSEFDVDGSAGPRANETVNTDAGALTVVNRRAGCGYFKIGTDNYIFSSIWTSTGGTFPAKYVIKNTDSVTVTDYGENAGVLTALDGSGTIKGRFLSSGEMFGISISRGVTEPGRLISDFGDILQNTNSLYFTDVYVYKMAANHFAVCYTTERQTGIKVELKRAGIDTPVIFANLSDSLVLAKVGNADSVIDVDNYKILSVPDAYVYPGFLGTVTGGKPQISYKAYNVAGTGRGVLNTGKYQSTLFGMEAMTFYKYETLVNVQKLVTSSIKTTPDSVFNRDAGEAFVIDNYFFPPLTNQGVNFLFSGSAYLNNGKLDYDISNQYPVNYTFFQLLGTTYAFDGSTIKIANETGGGIIQGLDTVAEADGLRFVAVGSDLAYFYSPYGNALYVFDGGRAVRKLQDLPQVGDLSGRIPQAAFQTSNSALYLPVTGAEILTLKDGVFSKIILPGALTTDVLQMQETVNGMTALTGTSTITGGRLIKYPSASVSVPVDPFRWETAQLGLGENHRVNVRQIVHLIRVKNATGTPVNLTMGYRYQTQDGYAVSTNNFPVTSSMLNNGILKVSYAPPVQAVLSFGVSVETALDVVLLESTVYYSPEGPAFYGPLSTVNGG